MWTYSGRIVSEESQKLPSTAHYTRFRYKLVMIFPLIP